ncbi:MAG: hypothetical protein K2N56_02925 [Oscillospiraceae bacterium]|nr:hypothetical protein [Oscillospiraceae bacterium]
MDRNLEREKALGSWLADVAVTSRPSDEDGIFLNKIIFTHKNGNSLCLVLFDVNKLDGESLDGGYYRAAGDAMAELPPGFPMINSVMYSEAAAKISKNLSA